MSAAILMASAIVLPGMVTQMLVGSRSLLSLPPRTAALLILGTLLCALVGGFGARSILQNEEEDD